MHDLYITNLMVLCFMYTVIVLSLFYMGFVHVHVHYSSLCNKVACPSIVHYTSTRNDHSYYDITMHMNNTLSLLPARFVVTIIKFGFNYPN